MSEGWERDSNVHLISESLASHYDSVVSKTIQNISRSSIDGFLATKDFNPLIWPLLLLSRLPHSPSPPDGAVQTTYLCTHLLPGLQ